jgi:hypothetical protein
MKHQEFDFIKPMPVSNYIEERIGFSLKRYRAKATMCRETYLYSSFLAVVIGSLVPILITFDVTKTVTVSMSFLVVLSMAMENVFRFRERWKNYQIAEELLRREKYLFQTQGEPYAKLDETAAYTQLVKNVEAIIKDERDKTIQSRSTEVKITKYRDE